MDIISKFRFQQSDLCLRYKFLVCKLMCPNDNVSNVCFQYTLSRCDVLSSSWCSRAAKEKSLAVMMNFHTVHATIPMILKLEFHKLKFNMIIWWCQNLPLTIQIRWVLRFLLTEARSEYFALKFGENLPTYLNYRSIAFNRPITGHHR